jgi:hypothetical protein
VNPKDLAEVFNEDFSTDPGWTATTSNQNFPISFGYNDTQRKVADPGANQDPGMFIRKGMDVSHRYFTNLRKPLTDSHSFRYSFDLGDVDFTGGVGPGIIAGLLKSDTSANVTDGSVNGVAVETRYSSYYGDQQFEMVLHVRLDDGGNKTSGALWLPGDSPVNRITVDYDASNRTFTFSFAGQGAPSWNKTITLAPDEHFSVDQFAIANRNSYASDAYGTTTVDNVALHARIAINENFSTDPGRTATTSNQSFPISFGYNGTQRKVAAPGANQNPGMFIRKGMDVSHRYFTNLRKPLTDSHSFRYSFDLGDVDFTGGVGPGIIAGLLKSDTSANVTDGGVNGVAVETRYSSYYGDQQFEMVLHVRLDDGGHKTSGALWLPGDSPVNRITVDYDTLNRTFNFSFAGQGAPSWNKTITLAPDEHFSVDQFAIANRNSYASDAYGTATVDRVTLDLVIGVDEDFSADPGWTATTSNQSFPISFGYNDTQRKVAAPGANQDPGMFIRKGMDVSHRYFKNLGKMLTDSDSFHYSFDLGDVDFTGGVGPGIIAGLFKSDTSANVTDGGVNGVAVETRYSSYYGDQQFEMVLHVRLDDGGHKTSGALWLPGDSPVNRITVDYDASNRTFTFSFAGQGAPSWNKTITLAPDEHFSVDQFAIANRNSYASDAYGTANVDNVKLDVLPPFRVSLTPFFLSHEKLRVEVKNTETSGLAKWVQLRVTADGQDIDSKVVPALGSVGTAFS